MWMTNLMCVASLRYTREVVNHSLFGPPMDSVSLWRLRSIHSTCEERRCQCPPLPSSLLQASISHPRRIPYHAPSSIGYWDILQKCFRQSHETAMGNLP